MATRVSESIPKDLRFEPTPKRVRAERDGAVVVDTTRALLVWEEGEVVPKYAAPADDVDRDRLPAEAARECADPDLDRRLLLDWDAFDRWREEEEEVVGHPRDPFHRIDIRRASRHVRIEAGGTLLAESDSPTLLFETGLPVRCYLPREDVQMDRLVPSDTRTTCAYKGHASYFSVRTDAGLEQDLAWTYPEPLPDNDQIRDLIAFHDERVDVWVDGERSERPATQWSR